MKLLKKLAATGLMSAAALTFSTNASAIVIGGIEFNGGLHVQVASVFEDFVTGDGSMAGDVSVLTGYGEVTSINGEADYCAGGGAGSCELTFQFGGYTVNPGEFALTDIVFSGGWINFYADTTPDFNPFTNSGGGQLEDIAEATDGTLWLTLAGHTDLADGGVHGVTTGTLFATGNNFGLGTDTGTGTGLVDVCDGTAAGCNGNPEGMAGAANGSFDTDSLPDNLLGTADFVLLSSFSTVGAPPHVPLTGQAGIQGIALAEPMSLALLGMGLFGVGMFTRRRG